MNNKVCLKLNCRCVIFDLDGTLIDAYKNIADNSNHTLAQMGYPVLPLDVVRHNVGGGTRDFWERFVKPEDVDRAEAIYRQRVKEHLFESTYLLPGVKQLLENIKKAGIKMAIASNKPALFSRPLLKQLAIFEYFDIIVCGDETANMKPHPESVLHIMNKLEVSVEETIYVGDMVIDIETALAAGVRCICVLTGSDSKGELSARKPFLILNQVSELSGYILDCNT